MIDMDILDICSWVPANELSLEKIKEIVLSLNGGKSNEEGYSLEMKLPINANENIISCSNDFISCHAYEKMIRWIIFE